MPLCRFASRTLDEKTATRCLLFSYYSRVLLFSPSGDNYSLGVEKSDFQRFKWCGVKEILDLCVTQCRQSGAQQPSIVLSALRRRETADCDRGRSRPSLPPTLGSGPNMYITRINTHIKRKEEPGCTSWA